MSLNTYSDAYLSPINLNTYSTYPWPPTRIPDLEFLKKNNIMDHNKEALAITPGKPLFKNEIEQFPPFNYDFSKLITGFSKIKIFKRISYASCWTSKLLTWRNGAKRSLGDQIKQGCKVIITEISLPLLTLAAIIETCVYSLLNFGAKALSPMTKRPLQCLEQAEIIDRKESASFTIRWTISMLYYNLLKKDLPDSEFQAKPLEKSLRACGTS